jgi:diguanylate cyclase (GGDEF)-like protein
MAAERDLLFFDGGLNDPPALLRDFATSEGLDLVPIADPEEVLQRASRSFPACLVLDARHNGEACIELCHRIKEDPFTAIIPVAVLVPPAGEDFPTRGLEAGADEVIHENASDREKYLRLSLLLRRAARDVSVHPTTRLPGTTQVERELARRLAAGSRFALCYADLDHFKEFNDRYGYNRGDRVIRLLSIILRDIVRAMAPGGYVGHIGGDDFLYLVPLEYMERTCDEILELFDTLIPYQYTDEDRRTGYYLGRDRRGNIYRIPLMTLSIGIVTNQFQEFTHPVQASERCAEMKTYAKTLPGSVYVVDRRQIDRQVGAARISDRERERGRE